jgi:hypothetical protein
MMVAPGHLYQICSGQKKEEFIPVRLLIITLMSPEIFYLK